MEEKHRDLSIRFWIVFVSLILVVLSWHFQYYLLCDPIIRETKKTNEMFAKTLSQTVFDDVGGQYPLELKVGYYETYNYQYCIIDRSNYESIYTIEGSQTDFNGLIFELEEIKETFSYFDEEEYYIWVNVQYNPKEKEYSPIAQLRRCIDDTQDILNES